MGKKRASTVVNGLGDVNGSCTWPTYAGVPDVTAYCQISNGVAPANLRGGASSGAHTTPLLVALPEINLTEQWRQQQPLFEEKPL